MKTGGKLQLDWRIILRWILKKQCGVFKTVVSFWRGTVLCESLVFCVSVSVLFVILITLTVFWNMTPCSVEDIYHHFGSDYRNCLFDCEVSTSTDKGGWICRN
jgi:nitrogen fixation-related uncharacterized protein